MAISFNQVPSNMRVPFLYAEFDNESAVSGPQVQPYRSMLIGPMLSSGTGSEKTKYLITSYEQALAVFGEGSILAEMAGKYLLNNKTNELYCIGLLDNAAGVPAVGSIEVGGAATKAGTLKLYINGKVAEVSVSNGDTPTVVAAAINAKIGADSKFVVSAAVNGVNDAIVDFTAKNDGTQGNDIDLRVNFYDGDETPEGLTTTLVAMNSGATNPDVDEAIAKFGEDQYLLIGTAWLDASSVSKMETELTDRFGPIRQNDGYAFYGARGTVSELNAIGDSYNSQFTVIHRAGGPTHPSEQIAAKMGVIAMNAQNDPARPFQTLAVLGILPESEDEKLLISERNILLYHGIATGNTISGGAVTIERVITTYKKNNAGADDVSYLDLNTLLTLSYIRYDWRNYMLRKYPRHKLASDGIQFAQGQKIMTPNLGKAEAIAKFREWESIGLVEGAEQFKEDLIVERNASDVNRLDFLLPTDLVNQLRVMGTKIGFLL